MNVQIGSINGLYYGMEMVALSNNEDKIYQAAYLYQNKTNYYKNPKISNTLYVLSDELKEIKKYYNDDNKSSAYNQLDLVSGKYLKEYSGNTSSNIKESLILSMYHLIEKNIK